MRGADLLTDAGNVGTGPPFPNYGVEERGQAPRGM